MAITKDISDLLGKTENDGANDAGRLTAKEWNLLVEAVQEVQTQAEGTIKGIVWKPNADGSGGQTFTDIDSRGYLKLSPADPQGDVTLFTIEEPAAYIASDAECNIKFYVSSKIPSGDLNVPAPVPCTVSYYIDNGDGKDVLVGTDSIYDFESATPGVKKEITFNFANIPGRALGTGDIDNKLTIELNNGYGKIVPNYFMVRVINLSMRVDSFGNDVVFNERRQPQLTCTVYGSDANVYAEVDGRRIIDGESIRQGISTEYGSEFFKDVNRHGVHNIKTWASVTKDLGNNETLVISTQPLEYTYIYGESISDPIVMANIANKKPEQYTNFNISYVAYKYNSSNTIVNEDVKTSIYEISSYDGSGKPVLGRELVSTTQNVAFDSITNSATNTASLSLFPVSVKKENSEEMEEVVLLGEMAVVIKVGDYQYVDTIDIQPSTIVLNEVPGYVVKLSSAGRSNDETTTLKDWSCTGKDLDGNLVTTTMTFDSNVEFANTGSGWLYDGDKYDATDPNDKGSVAMRLRKGRKCTLNYNPFKVNPTYNSQNNSGNNRGMTISIEFATRNSLNQNATVISCLERDRLGVLKGFEVLANKATIYSDNVDLYADFKEDTRIKLDFVIDGKQWAYKYNTVSGTGKDGDEVTYAEGTSEEALCIIYVDGVYQALATIPANTSFQQSTNGVPIVFGSDECDIDIYNIRIYNQALTPIQIIQNYAYDTPNVKNKLAIASRNQNVLIDNPDTPQKPNINIEGLRKARPELPFFYVEMETAEDSSETLPQDKSAWKLMKMTEFKNPKNESSLTDGVPSFEVKHGVMRNQGTSSMTYPWPWRNWDWKTKDDDFASYDPDGKYHMPTLANPVVSSKYWPQYKGMHNIESSEGKGNIKKITLKKDYASSEMCNNAITSEMFTDMANGIGDAIPGALSLAQRNSGGKNSPYRLTFVAQPCFMFRRFSDTTKPSSAGNGIEALGMMNLIPNKNECAYLGFFGNYTWDPDKGLYSQSWELSDNYPEIFWRQKLDGVKYISSTEHTNDIDGIYEARYPKDTTVFFDDNGEADGDFGMTSGNITTDQEKKVRDEQAELLSFHNWLVDCNRQIAKEYFEEHGEYRTLSVGEENKWWNIDSETNQPITRVDDPDYRLRKFKAEAPTRMLVDQFALYYIWRETFWAYDSGFKNLQIYTMGRAKDGDGVECDYMQWGCMVRDADTTLGIQNQGRIEFLPYLEDTDYYVETDGVKTYYFDALKDSWDEKDINTLGGKHVLNGQLGALWINLRDAFAENIENVYVKLRENSNTTNWASARAIKRFRDHQEKWCESLYNFGMRQYFGGAPFTKWIESGLGDKKNSRASWLEKAFYYRDSKYRAYDPSSDYAAFRAGCYYTPDFNSGDTTETPLKFKLYQPAYLMLGDNEVKRPNGYHTRKRITDVTNHVDVLPEELRFPLGTSSAMNVHYGTKNMIEIGDFARVCKIYEIQAWNFPKLKSLLLGHESARDGVTYYEHVTDTATNEKIKVPFSNGDLVGIDLSSFKQLQVLDITNHTAIGNVNASYCTELRELYARGCTSTRTIDLPNSTTLEKIYLPYTITNINLVGLRGIKEFVLDVPTGNAVYGINRLEISDCGNYMAARSYDIVKQTIDTLKNAYNPDIDNNNICILSGINWENVEVKYLEALLNIDAKLSGVIKLQGSASLSNELKVKLVNAYGNIDDTNNSLYIEYKHTKINDIVLPNKYYFFEPNKTYYPAFTTSPKNANTYKNAVWSITGAGGMIEKIDPETGAITRSSEAPNKNIEAELTVTVYQIPDTDGEERESFTRSCKVYFYERLAKPGDIVYSDGSFSDDYDENKNPIGVCFYVDPDNPEKRLMCALNSVEIPGITIGYPSNVSWGVQNQYGNYSEGSDGGGFYYGSNPNLKIEGSNYNCYDIKAIDNLASMGPTNVNADTNCFTDAIYRDTSLDESTEKNGYFKIYNDKTFFGNIGWGPAKEEVKVDRLTLPDGGKSISIKAKDNVPFGYYNTLAMIAHRNTILDEYYNPETGDFARPSDGGDNEMYYLGQYMQSADYADYAEWESSKASSGQTYGAQLYYPAASACFAYEPNASGLLDKFKKYNWFLPSSGDLVRLLYYCYHSWNGSSAIEELTSSQFNDAFECPANAFAKVLKYGNILNLEGLSAGQSSGNYSLWSSVECSSGYAVSVASKTGYCNYTAYKNNYSYVRPICVF